MKWAHRTPDVGPEHRLLVTAALADDSVAAAAWDLWRRSVNFDDIDGASQRLLPLIVRRAGVIPESDPVRGRVRGMYRQAWVNNHRLWSDAGGVLDQLGAAGVPAMVLKGASLIGFYDDDWGVRPMFDIDLAVPTTSVTEALAVVREAGWTTELGQSDAWVGVRMRRQRHSWGHERGEREHLDLHWRITSDVMWDDADAGWWNGAQQVRIADRDVTVMHPADILLHVLVHGTRGGNCPPVQWIVDAAHVARRLVTDDAGLQRWTERARSLDLVLALRAALDVAVDVSNDASLRVVAERLPRSVTVIDRLRMLSGPLEEVGAQIARDAAGGAGLGRGVLGALRRLTEVDLVSRPRLAMVETLMGRPQWLTRRRYRRIGTLSRPPVRCAALSLPVRLDLTVPDTLDHHGGPGWRVVASDGTRTANSWSCLVVDLAEGQMPTIVGIELRALERSRHVEVLVDGRVVLRTEVATHMVRVEAAIVRSQRDTRPLEIVLRGCRRGRFGRRSATDVAVSAVDVR